ncbi:MAG TPA: hypothetical protein VGD50_01855 [Candidatus Baltobacteraceae bacterium]
MKSPRQETGAFVGGPLVGVAVGVGFDVGIGVAVGALVGVGVAVAVAVGVGFAVPVGVGVGFRVLVGFGDGVGVAVLVGFGVGVGFRFDLSGISIADASFTDDRVDGAPGTGPVPVPALQPTAVSSASPKNERRQFTQTSKGTQAHANAAREVPN